MKKTGEKKQYFGVIVIYIICCVVWALNAAIHYNKGHIGTCVLSVITCVLFGLAGILYAYSYKKNKETKDE